MKSSRGYDDMDDMDGMDKMPYSEVMMESETHLSDAYLSIDAVAAALEMTTSGVHKLISRGKLKAIRRSERRIYVSRAALAAYRARLNGAAPNTRRPTSHR
jgi:hypothetical protein